MTDRLDVLKTYKLFIDGKFPRSESGRSRLITGPKGSPVAHVSLASRKDLRDAVEAARKSQQGWAAATAYNRGQVLYRMAEMLEGKRREFEDALRSVPAAAAKKASRARALTPGAETAAAVDLLVHYAGWADKFAQVLGCNNPVAGPYYNFTIPEPTGVVAVVTPDAPALLSLVGLIAPPLCAGNTIVALAGEANPIIGALLGEVCATSDVPPGAVNILTGLRSELVPHVAAHRDIDAVHASGLSPDESALLRGGAAENLKRVRISPALDWTNPAQAHGPWHIEPFLELKTVWHPASV